MQGKFICHKDFSSLKPIDVFHKEHEKKSFPETEEKYKNRHILFRKKVTLADYNAVVIDITADDYFKLYVNGKFVMAGTAAVVPWRVPVYEKRHKRISQPWRKRDCRAYVLSGINQPCVGIGRFA